MPPSSSISAVLVDDEIRNIELLKTYLNTFLTQVDVKGTAQNVKDAVWLINDLKPQLLFLDIKLTDGTAFDILDAIEDKEVKVICITSYDSYGIEAFKYGVSDYVLKPISVEELVLSVRKVQTELEKEHYVRQNRNVGDKGSSDSRNNLDFIAVPYANGIHFVKLNEIIYLRSEGHSTEFFLTNETRLTSNRILGEFESSMDRRRFFRIHNSYLVNLHQVTNINNENGSYCVMSNGDRLPIARRRQDALDKFLKLK